LHHLIVKSKYVADIPDLEKRFKEGPRRVEGGENISHINTKLRTTEGAWKSVEGTADNWVYDDLLLCASFALNHSLVEQLLTGFSLCPPLPPPFLPILLLL
jgi:hypothetical protein